MILPLLVIAVKVQALACTTEPAPKPPSLRALRAPRHYARLRVVGEGGYCSTGWSVEVAADGGVTLAIGPDAPACPSSCDTTIRIGPLARGAHLITLDGASVTVRVR